ncbi:serine/threonine-protein kinase [Arthrobacter sp. FW306-04-A]|uniref:serine/threonine-protein kinase n=1 Tax=Arthrobacter sp. FW306-04-A TaxID=2879619 RepID=UPI0037C06DD9|nr:serine/threonine protein kinase [Arthrobacter sp. FW306-04-A]
MTAGAKLLDEDVVAAFPEFEIATPRLGEGSFKAAFLASSGDETFVVKILLGSEDSDTDEEVVLDQRFIREIKVMAELDSSRIVKLHLPVETRKIGRSVKVWYAEPHYAGGSLDSIFASRKLSKREIVVLALHLFEGLRALEVAGIIHRDVKPGNICQTADGGFVLLDLGIAQVLSLEPLTATNAVSPRTNRYAAPEQFVARGQTSIDARTDLFAAGIVLFEAVTGRHPFFEGESMSFDSYYRRLTSHQPGQLSDEDCDPALQVVIDRCLAARQNRRFRTVGQALNHLRELEPSL